MAVSRLVAVLAVFVGVVWAGTAAATATATGEDRYVVVLEKSAGRPGVVAKRHAEQRGAKVRHVFDRAFDGYSADLSPGEAKAIARQPGVAAVGREPEGELAAQTLPTGVQRIYGADADCFPGDNAAVNSLIDIDCIDDARVDVDVAVLDTGIDATHLDLNVAERIDCFGGDSTPEDEDPTDHAGCVDDENTVPASGWECAEPHGTAMAGVIGALDNGIGVVGVAPGARLWSVRVADNDVRVPTHCAANPQPFYMSDVIAGVEWVTQHADDIEVANMSMLFDVPATTAGQALDQALEQAIDTSIAAGVVYVVAAGNESSTVTGYSPAQYTAPITASGIADFDGQPGGNGTTFACGTGQTDDNLATISNYGPTIDITAPTCSASTLPGNNYAPTGPGTSLSSAHTAGAAAILASQTNPNTTQDVNDIRQQLIDTGNTNTTPNNGWNDTSNDAHKEPLLDVSDDAIYNPATTPGNGVDTVGMYLPSVGMWQLRDSNSSGSPDHSFGYWWSSLDIPVTGDWNGDGIDTIGMYWSSLGDWQLRDSNTSGAPDYSFGFSNSASDTPVTGDWDGDGIDTIGTYSPSSGMWRLRNSNSSGSPNHSFSYQTNTSDIPVTGDWDGDGIDTIGTYSPSSGMWRLRDSNSSGSPDHSFGYWWSSLDIPVTGDWNSDGIDTIGMYWSSLGMWQLRDSNSSGSPDHSFGYWWSSLDIPVTGDWNGG